MNKDVFAIIVTYNTHYDKLDILLKILAAQCSVVVVDNSTQIISQDMLNLACVKYGVFYCRLGDNYGIAAAQNFGVAFARNHAAVDILLMDDDSVPGDFFVSELILARRLCNSSRIVVGARTISDKGKDISNCSSNGFDALTPCDQLTSSGSLIPIYLFEFVGLFDEELFIDCVDFEWGWRARALGVMLLLSTEVSIKHKLGESTRLGLKIPSPIRHYYQYRNILKMIFHSNAPLLWRLSQLIKLPIKLILLLIIADRRINRLRFVGFGVIDFIAGRFGKFNHN